MNLSNISGWFENVRSRMPTLSKFQKISLAVLTITILAILPFMPVSGTFIEILALAFMFGIMGQSWNIIGGYAGQMSIGHALFFAIGAYGTMIPLSYYGITPMIGLFIAAFLAGIVAVALGFVTFRLTYHYFAMGTLAIALVARSIATRLDYIGGSQGLQYPLEDVGAINLVFNSQLPYYYLMGGFLLVSSLLVYRLDNSKLGLYLKAINMDQELAENAGIKIRWYKQYALFISAYLMGLSGGLYSLSVQYIDPSTTLPVIRNVEPIVVATLGGLGTVLGPILGAGIFTFVNEYTRILFGASSTGLGWVIFGTLVVIIAMYRPGGLLNKLPGGESDK